MGYILMLIGTLPWLIPAIGFLITIDRRGYSPWVGALSLILTGFIGLAGLAGVTALRTWMVWKTLLAPIILWMIAFFLPRRLTASHTAHTSSVMPYILISIAWGGWLFWNAFVLVGATSVRGSTEHGNIAQVESIRSGISIYKMDLEKMPEHLEDIIPRGLSSIPELQAIAADDRILHPRTRQVKNFESFQPDDAGGWGYVTSPRRSDGSPNPDFGRVFINCTHMDLRGTKRLADY